LRKAAEDSGMEVYEIKDNRQETGDNQEDATDK
jgi:hypothetical protein